MKRIAVDLAKSVYQVAESVRSGQVVQRKRLNREAFRRYIQEQTEPVEWVMEACGTAHYWGRVAQSLGHRVKLLHPRYVRPYRRRNKTDRNDCDAMLEAARCTDIHPVPVKTNVQQQLQQLHGLRETWKKSVPSASTCCAAFCVKRESKRLPRLPRLSGPPMSWSSDPNWRP
ncbi:Transposase [Pseudomonas cuatrocienegasensis]|uniref:Transposase n=1 Tax=Pseudomonas cuatrocienegasensis TaxID=543360 RepID=A0ABY1BIG6_9PSED|nr:Transposase [Pseudomonas cuatrocienegasensis]